VLLEVENIDKEYSYPSGDSFTVLNGLSLQVSQKAAIAIIGPSGSGKSTLLNIIGALDKPTSGFVKLDSENLTLLDEKKLARIRNKKIGFVFQLHHLLPQCTVLENVLIPTLASEPKANMRTAENRAKQLLQKVSLQKHFQFRPAQLSGGELQRVAVVRALINQPQLLLADEPTGSLDQHTSENLVRLLLQLNTEENIALIMVTHSSQLVKQMQTVYQLTNGKLEKLRSTDNIDVG
jgi:ABC-type lipoprotein export system ATPase subunit